MGRHLFGSHDENILLYGVTDYSHDWIIWKIQKFSTFWQRINVCKSYFLMRKCLSNVRHKAEMLFVLKERFYNKVSFIQAGLSHLHTHSNDPIKKALCHDILMDISVILLTVSFILKPRTQELLKCEQCRD